MQAHKNNIDQSEKYFLPLAEDPYSVLVLENAALIAKSPATVLICGETGVGKELLANYIHQHSSVSQGPLVSVNCAAIPHNMIEAILFGYKKGAFTGAINNYIGKFEQAHNGTLFLDEIAEIPFDLQAKLLRVLQEKEIERLGGESIIKIHTRIIAATNRQLSKEVAEGRFRKDLYYRLNVMPIYCPALRERVADIIPLAEYFLRIHSQTLNKKPPLFSESAKNKLREYHWPGNVRELENIIQRVVIFSKKDVVEASDISLIDEIAEFYEKKDTTLKENETEIILSALKKTKGNRSDAAKKLNISPRTLRYKISKLKSIGFDVP